MAFDNDPFHYRTYTSISDFFHFGLNEEFWRHAITFSQGNGWNTAWTAVKGRLEYLRARLVRAIFGNHWRKKGRIHFLGFKHGFENSFNTHFHVLMGIIGVHDWPDLGVEHALYEIDSLRPGQMGYEKSIHIDCDWRKNNQMHSYVSRFVQSGSDAFSLCDIDRNL